MSKTVKLAELILDWGLYPRASVDSMQVGKLAEAIRAEEPIPPIIVDAASMRIVDGFHRYHAYERLQIAEVEVILEKYKDEGALFLRAVTLNARHGVPLAPQDIGRALLIADRLHINRANIAGAFGIRPERIASIEAKMGHVKREGMVYLKPAIRHFAGGEVSKEVAAINPKLGGNNADFSIGQLLLLIRSGGLNLTEKTAALLLELADAIAGLKLKV